MRAGVRIETFEAREWAVREVGPCLGDQALLGDAAVDEDIFCGDVAQDWFAEMDYDLGVGD